MRTDRDTSTSGNLSVGASTTVQGNLQLGGFLVCTDCSNAASIANEAGIAFVNGGTVGWTSSDAGTVKNISSLTLKSPGPGFLLIQATGHTTRQTNGGASVGIGTDAQTFIVTTNVQISSSSNSNTASTGGNSYAVSTVVPVNKGYHTYFLNASGGRTFTVFAESFHAIYFPTSYQVTTSTEAQLDSTITFTSKTQLSNGTLIYQTTSGARTFEKVAVDKDGNDLYAEVTGS
jgi:hypothetical protein